MNLLRTDVQMPMSAKKREEIKKKKTYSEWGHADANALLRMALRADANECKKKRRKKKLTWNGGIQTRMRCVRMVLRADGVACGWCCVQTRCMGTWMVVAAEMVGTDECKEKTKK